MSNELDLQVLLDAANKKISHLEADLKFKRERNGKNVLARDRFASQLTTTTARIAELESVIDRLQTPAMVSERQGWEICAEQRDKLASATAEVANLKELIRIKDAALELAHLYMPKITREALSTTPSSLRAEPGRLVWISGEPSKVYRDEWFIAKLKDGKRAVLRSLPEEFSYDYKTADDTYYKRDWIVAWMQMPDSEFIAPEPNSLRAEVEAKK